MGDFLKRIVKSRITRSCLAILILYFIISKFNIDVLDIFNNIKHPIYLFLVVGLTLILNPFVSNTRWKIFLEYSGIEIPLITLIKISFKSIFYALLLPSAQAADGFRMYAIEKLNPDKRGVSGGTVIADRMIGFIVFSFIACIGSYFLPANDDMIKIRAMIFGLTIVLLLVTLLITNKVIYRLISRLLQKINFLHIVIEYFNKIYLGLTEFPYKKIVPKVFPLIVIFQLTNILIAHLIFLAFGYDIDIYYHLALIPVIQVITILPVSMANLGVREGLFIYFYGFIDIPHDIAFSVSLLYLMLTGFVSAILGGVLVIFESSKEKPKSLSK